MLYKNAQKLGALSTFVEMIKYTNSPPRRGPGGLQKIPIHLPGDSPEKFPGESMPREIVNLSCSTMAVVFTNTMKSNKANRP